MKEFTKKWNIFIVACVLLLISNKYVPNEETFIKATILIVALIFLALGIHKLYKKQNK